MTETNSPGPAGSPLEAAQLVDMYYLSLRSALLETAAGLDRIQRAPGGETALQDPRIEQIRHACRIISGPGPDRARQFQQLLSSE
jgi:hypothetical protein